jgi:hypothetical protein
MAFGLGVNMSLFDNLLKALPELSANDFHPTLGTIKLQDDSDGQGSYIAEWDYHLPIPQGFKLGK